MAMGSFFRVSAFACATAEEAQSAPAGIVAVQVLFSGFMISVKLMGWMKFLYYTSIFAYGLHSLAINEFTAVHYTDRFVPTGA